MEPKITQHMVEAGVTAYWHLVGGKAGFSVTELVEAVYRAMNKEKQRCTEPS